MRSRAPVLRMLALLGLALAWAAPAPVHAQQWRDLAMVSGTTGTSNGRVCYGQGSSFINCPDTAPYVNQLGWLGIGTGTPASLFHVVGTDGGVRVDNTGNVLMMTRPSINYFRASDPSGSFAIATGGTTTRMFINTNGYIGIGKAQNTPVTMLDISGTLRISSEGETCNTSRLGAIRFQSGSFDVCRNATNGWEPLATTGANSAIDRITSNSMAGVTANDTGYISLTTGGVTGTVYFTPSGNLVNSGISTTGTISGTSGYLGNLRLGQTGAFTNAISPFQSYGDIVGDYAGIGGLELRNINGGPNADFRFVISDDRGAGGSTLNFSMSSSNNTNTLFGQPRNQMATLFVNGNTDAIARALAIGTLKAHPLILGTNNNEAMRIVSTGNVGIGTTAPGAGMLLDVSGSTRIRSALYIGSLSNNSRIYGLDTATYIGLHWGQPDITFNTNGLRRMTVASTNLGTEYGGRVGIGSMTYPSTTLDVSGSLKLRAEPSGNAGEVCDTNRLGAIRYTSGSFDVCRNTTNGWEPIATTGAGSLADRITSGTTQMIVYNNTSATIATQGVERMVVGTNGNIGIAQQPETNVALAVSGTIKFNNGVVAIQNPNTASGYGLIQGVAGFEALSNNYERFQIRTPSTSQVTFLENAYAGTGAARDFAFATGGSERLRIKTDGKVGINTSTPSAVLDVQGAIRLGARAIAVTSMSAVVLPKEGGYISWNQDNGLGRTNFMNHSGIGGGGFDFSMFDSSGNFVSTPLVINHIGNVGIGTTAPTTRLGVSGTLKIANGGESCDTNRLGAIRYGSGSFDICRNTTNGWEPIATATSATDISINTGLSGSIVFRDELGKLKARDTFSISSTNGSVGIGAGVPSYSASNSLFALGNIYGNNLYAGSAGKNLYWGDGSVWIHGNDTSDHLAFIVSATEALRVVSNGYVGIGTTTPSSSLHVLGTTTLSSNTAIAASIDIATPLNIGGQMSDPSLSRSIRIQDGSGNLAGYIGSTGEASTSNKLVLFGNRGMGGIQLRTSNANTMNLLPNGLVGISTTEPSTSLHVAGSVRLGSEASTTLQTCDANRLGAIRYGSGSFDICRNTTNGWEPIATATSATDISINTGLSGSLVFRDELGKLKARNDLSVSSTTGSVGIGAGAPASLGNSGLYVSGSLQTNTDLILPYGNALRASGFAYNTLFQTGWNGFADYLALFTAGNGAENLGPKIVVLSNGNIGMGTATPTNALDVSGTLRLISSPLSCDTNHVGAIRFISGSFDVCRNTSNGWEPLATATSATDIAINTGLSGSLVFRDELGKLKARNDLSVSSTTGSVGIGAGAPASLGNNGLYVSGQIRTGDNVFLPSGGYLAFGNTADSINGNSSTGNHYLTFTTSNTEALRIVSTGYVGIGTPTPTTNFEVLGNQGGGMAMPLSVRNSVAGGAAGFQATNSAGTTMLMGIGNNSNGSGLRNRGYIGFSNAAIPLIINAKTVISTGAAVNVSGPSTTLDISGTLKIANSGETCDTDRLGAIRYNGSAFSVCANTTNGWEPLATTGGSASADRITSGTTGVYTYTDTSVSIATAGVERVVIGTDGTVGIGRQPTVGVAFAVSGNISVNGRIGVLTTSDSNVYVGSFAGSTASGQYNTGLGQGAFQSNTGSNNVAVGRYSGQSNSGSDSTFAGSSSGQFNTGSSVSGFGTNAAQNNSATSVVAIGNNAAQSNRPAGNNAVFVGNDAGQFNSGVRTTGLGSATAQRNSGDNLSALGSFAGQWNSGANTTAVGFSTAQYNTGANVTALGQLAANKNTADQVTAIGYNAVSAVSNTFTNITGLGYDAQPTKSNQVMLGNTLTDEIATYGAGIFGKWVRVGSATTALMTSATITGAGSIMYDSTLNALRYSDGSQWNTLSSGSSSADRIISGTTGMYTYNNTSATIATNGVERMVIGTNGEIGIAQQPQTGYALAVSGSSYFNGDINHTGSIYGTSDARLKTNVTTITRAVDTLSQLRPVSFEFKARRGHTEYGFLAQEVRKVYPALVNTANDTSHTLSVNYTGLIAPMVQGLTEVNTEVKQLKSENAALRAELEAMRAEIRAIAKQQAIAGTHKAP
ncbi:MAG: hypothetical protein DI585_05400 [Pseudomonas fluorescens]|nr:MAG: hypothetical protein DI585_05400 [Pseudomonas fluorescens]